MRRCECDNRYECKIDSQKKLAEVNGFFDKNQENGTFLKEPAEKPYYIWRDISRKDKNGRVRLFADAWYKCKICGCLWEVKWPDFPAIGFVKKYDNGEYTGTEEIIVDSSNIIS